MMKKRIILSAIIAACTTMCLTMSVYADGEGMNGFENPPEETANKLQLWTNRITFLYY